MAPSIHPLITEVLTAFQRTPPTEATSMDLANREYVEALKEGLGDAFDVQAGLRRASARLTETWTPLLAARGMRVRDVEVALRAAVAELFAEVRPDLTVQEALDYLMEPQRTRTKGAAS